MEIIKPVALESIVKSRNISYNIERVQASVSRTIVDTELKMIGYSMFGSADILGAAYTGIYTSGDILQIRSTQL